MTTMPRASTTDMAAHASRLSGADHWIESRRVADYEVADARALADAFTRKQLEALNRFWTGYRANDDRPAVVLELACRLARP